MPDVLASYLIDAISGLLNSGVPTMETKEEIKTEAQIHYFYELLIFE